MNKFKKTICLIGARKNSKRIPLKNIRLLNNIPLIAYPIMTGLSLKLPVYVSSDSSQILDIATSYGATIIKRPPEYALDTSTDFEWIIHALREFWEKGGDIPSEIVFLRPTTPIRDINIVKRGIDSLKPEFTSLRSVEPLKEAIEKSFIIEKEKLEPSYPNITLKDTNNPNQSFPTSYTANGYVDILRPKVILEGDLYGKNIMGFIVPSVIEIDREEDFQYNEFLLKRK